MATDNVAVKSIVLSFMLAVCLMLVPIPSEYAFFKPDIATLVLMHWWLVKPDRIGVFVGFLIGLITDALYGSLLGQYAIGNVFIAWVFAKNYQRLRVLFLWQQAMTIFFLLILKFFIVFWINKIRAHHDDSFIIYLVPCLTSALIWPFVVIVMRNVFTQTLHRNKG